MHEVPEFEHAGLTDVGVKRSHNQDAFAVHTAGDPDSWRRGGHVFLVADGMGGHAVGEKASAKAANEIPHTYLKYAEDGPAAALRRAFLEANAGIHAIGQENPEFRGLGTTGTALILRPEGAWLGHVGDSRVYRVRDGFVEQLTYDHSLQWELARREGVRPEELPDIRKNVIVRSLGPDALVQVDVEGPHPLCDNDAFLLCSDGLSNQITDEEIGAIVGTLPPEEACRFLIELANLRGGPDNITAIVVRVGEVGQPPISPRTGRMKKAVKAWKRRVPWPLTVMLLGLLLAVGFIIASTAEYSAAPIFFVLAFAAIGVGLFGLIRDAMKSKAPKPGDEYPPPEANIYRELDCRPTKSLVERFGHIGEELRQQARERNWKADLDGFARFHCAAGDLLTRGELSGAFREECRAVLILARCFNQNRQKEEAFQPKWDIVPSGK